MVEPRSPPIEVGGDGRRLAHGLEKLEPAVADLQEADLDALLGHLLDGLELEAQGLVELDAFGEGLDGDSDVVEGRSGHCLRSFRSPAPQRALRTSRAITMR